MRLSGWGRHPVLDCRVLEPLRPDDLVAAVTGNASVVARGAGRSYGDAALNPSATISMLGMNRLRSFDDDTGVLECEAGALLGDIVEVFLPRGWFPVVTPGTKFVTVGGMIAADVHGKNHHVDGSFGDHVLDFTIVTADGSVVTCSPEAEADLFNATIGGMGLTGVILSGRFRLRRVTSAFMNVRTSRFDDLEALREGLHSSAESTYSVAWIDCQARGARRGRGLVFAGEHADPASLAPSRRESPLVAPRRRRLAVSVDLPAGLLHCSGVWAFNALYHRWPRRSPAIVDVDRFFYPLDAIGGWNRIYGRRGLVQFQCVLPAADGGAGLARLIEAIAASGLGSFLAVLKRLGPGRGGLSFPIEGHTLALDFPAGLAAFRLYATLCAITAEHRGHLYLAKDALASAGDIADGYRDRAAAFAEARRRSGAAARFSSSLSRRVSL